MMEDEPGTFFLTDFLARHFDALVIEGLGLDRFPQLRDDYFGHYRRLVYLAQFDDPETDREGGGRRRPARPCLRTPLHRARVGVLGANLYPGATGPREDVRKRRSAARGAEAMASLTILYWRDIPSQVIVKAGRKSAKRELSERFIRAIDAAAMHAGATSADAYLADWRRGDPSPCGDDLEAEASAAAARLEAEYDNHGWPSSPSTRGAKAEHRIGLRAPRPYATAAKTPRNPDARFREHDRMNRKPS